MIKKILIGLALMVSIVVGIIVYQRNIKPLPNISATLQPSKFLEVKSDNQNGVEVVIKPQVCDDFCNDSAIFEVSFTTHEGDLDFDLAKVSTLEVDGKVLPAKSWDGDSGGHHLEGNLVFPGVEKSFSRFDFTFNSIAEARTIFPEILKSISFSFFSTSMYFLARLEMSISHGSMPSAFTGP